MPSILFICTANQFRSPLSAAILQKSVNHQEDRSAWVIESAGTWIEEGLPVLMLTKKNADRLGLVGVNQHLTHQVNAAMLEKFDLIIVMESGHKEALCAEFKFAIGRVYMLSEVVDGMQYDIPDPVIPGIQPEDVATELHSLITTNAPKIFALARKIHSSRSN
jgi:protein-tyrosine-phosphatase